MSCPNVYPAPRGEIPQPYLSSGSDHRRSHIGPSWGTFDGHLPNTRKSSQHPHRVLNIRWHETVTGGGQLFERLCQPPTSSYIAVERHDMFQSTGVASMKTQVDRSGARTQTQCMPEPNTGSNLRPNSVKQGTLWITAAAVDNVLGACDGRAHLLHPVESTDVIQRLDGRRQSTVEAKYLVQNTIHDMM